MRARMSFGEPAPSMIVVFSFSTRTFLARPRSLSWRFSSLMPRSSKTAWPPVSVAMSSSMALRRSPNAGRLDGADGEDAAELVHDQRRQRLAFHFLADDQQRLARARDRFQDRHDVLHGGDLLLVDQDVRLLEDALHRRRVGDEVGRAVPLVELHPLDDLDLGLQRLALFDGDDAVLADLVHRLGDHLADFRIVVGGDAADVGDLCARPDLDGHALRFRRPRPRRRGRSRA